MLFHHGCPLDTEVGVCTAEGVKLFTGHGGDRRKLDHQRCFIGLNQKGRRHAYSPDSR